MSCTAHCEDLNWRNVMTVGETVTSYPERMRALIDALDLKRPGLEAVKTAVERDDLTAACEALVAYYRRSHQIDWLRRPDAVAVNNTVIAQADQLLDDVYFGFGETGAMPRTEDGHLDWSHKGPQNDVQFRCRTNRHSHLNTLIRAYLMTGNARYAQRIDLDLRDFLTAAAGQVTPWGTQHLEPALRMPVWARIFYGLQQDEHFQPSTRLLLLAAVPEHAAHLVQNTGGGNWVSMTQNGALTGGVCWPEFQDADKWCAKAVAQLQANARDTVYPDGAQKELTAHYHMVTLSRYEAAADLLRKGGRDVPADFGDILVRMWNYIVFALRPNGMRPLNNDSDLGSERRDALRAARTYGRDDWLYTVSNGVEGTRPEGPPSRMFPWAGQLVSRDGWGEQSHWSFFDVGPSGFGGHRHLDFGHLSIMAQGRYLLMDSGRFAYQGTIAQRFRYPYAMVTRSHNTILIDGQGQGKDPDVTGTPLTQGEEWQVAEDVDFARGTWAHYPDLEGRVLHRRSLLYLRGAGWVVVDRIETDRARDVEVLWHFHPQCSLTLEDAVVTADNSPATLTVAPVGPIEWNAQIVKGQNEPNLQGWYSRTYGEYEEAPCARYMATIEGTATFAWLLWPDADRQPHATLESADRSAVKLELRGAGGTGYALTVPVSGGMPAAKRRQ